MRKAGTEKERAARIKSPRKGQKSIASGNAAGLRPRIRYRPQRGRTRNGDAIERRVNESVTLAGSMILLASVPGVRTACEPLAIDLNPSGVSCSMPFKVAGTVPVPLAEAACARVIFSRVARKG
jgi:hypothetical protein